MFSDPFSYNLICDQTDKFLNESKMLDLNKSTTLTRSILKARVMDRSQRHIQTAASHNYHDENSKMLNKVNLIDQDILNIKYQQYLREVDELNTLKEFLSKNKATMD